MTIPSQLTAHLHTALQTLAGPELPIPADFRAEVTPAADTRYGDYQTNAAMVLAKALKTNPRALAEKLLAAFPTTPLTPPPTIAGPGFINFSIHSDHLAAHLSSLLTDPRLGVGLTPTPQTIVIDFSAPNVAKQMHIGHVRGTIIGDCLTRVARFLGHHVITDNHIGDWGTQFGMILHGWKQGLDGVAGIDEAALLADPIPELLRIYRTVNTQCKTEEDAAAAGGTLGTPTRDASKAELVALQAGDPTNLAIWQRCVQLSLEGLGRVYEQLDVTFDHYLGESHYNPRLPSLVQEFQDKNLAVASNGALCVFFPDDPTMQDKAPFMIRKSDGGYGYATTDLATAEHRVKTWHADAIWYVVGAPQALHFQQLFAACRQWGLHPQMEHIAFGSILGDDGRMMKTRSGESVGLLEVIQEAQDRARAVVEEKNPDLSAEEKETIATAVGIGSIKYQELSQHRLTDYKFAWDRMLSLQGNTAPYLLYSYVRTRSIFRKLDGPVDHTGPYQITAPEEKTLALQLARFAEVVPAVLTDFRPNLLATHVYEIARSFHSFFEACPVLRAEGTERATRLALCEATSRVLQTGLRLLGIRTTERM